MQSLFKKKVQQTAEESKKPDESKTSSAQLRVQKDLDDLTIDPNVSVSKPDPKNIMELIVTINITEPDSYWRGGKYEFLIVFGLEYPIKPPNVKLLTKIFHPNIELLSGNVCLSILRKEWTPVLSLTGVIMGLEYLFFEPEPTDPLNLEAAEMMRNSVSDFASFVKKTLKGGSYYGAEFKKFI